MTKVKIKKSKVAGKGLFAKEDIKKGEVIGTVFDLKNHNNKCEIMRRARWGRYINDSAHENAIFKIEGDRGVLIAKNKIKKDEEIFSNYKKVGRKLGIKIKMAWRK